jgi:hypothetical protein
LRHLIDAAAFPFAFLAACGNHFGFFLPLAGISTLKKIKDNPIAVRTAEQAVCGAAA